MSLEVQQSRLAQLLVGIVIVGLPYFPRLPIPALMLVFLLALWGLAIVFGKTKNPSVWIRTLLLLLVISTMYISYGTLLGRNVGTALLILLSFMKLFENKSQRDIFIIIFTGYFLIASNFFFTQEPWTVPYVFVSAVYLTALMIVFADRLGTTTYKERYKMASKMIFQAVPLMLVLFVLFPRIPGPIWGLPKDATSSSSGLSENMSPGTLSDLILSDEVAFRVRFAGEAPSHKNLYWRGPVFSHYDGYKWTANAATRQARPNLKYSSNPDNLIRYIVTLQPHQRNWLFALEHPLPAENYNYRISRELQIFNNRKVTAATQYTMVSDRRTKNFGLFPQERVKNLQLPEGYNERTVQLAQKWLQQSNGNHQEVIKIALRYFNRQNFRYTLSPAPLGSDAMDDFLFDTREGFCEHYSSAFVYLMRAAGIPSRVVTGYQGGEINPIDNYMIVRQSSAHAWSEVWLDNRGWVRYDPTAAVSPSRVEQGIQSAVSEHDQLPNILTTNSQLLRTLQYQWDSFNNAWSEWVIGFNQAKQKLLFKNLGFNNIGWRHLVLWMTVAMMIAGGLLALWILRRNNFTRNDVVRRHYDIFCQKMARHGIDRKPIDGPLDYQDRIEKTSPVIGEITRLIIDKYIEITYGGNKTLKDISEFKHLVNNLKIKAI